MRRTGIVVAQDFTQWRAQVQFLDYDQVKSWWLGILVRKTQRDKAAWMPDIGEQVVCLLDEHAEDGEILGSRYSTADMPVAGGTAAAPSYKFVDGALFKYDSEAHAATITLPSGATIAIECGSAYLTLDAEGNWHVNPPMVNP